MTYEQQSSGRDFQMSRVVSGTFAAVLKDFPVLIFGAVAISGLPTAYGVWATIRATEAGETFSTHMGISILVSVISTSILSGYIMHTVAQRYRGVEVSIGDSLAAAIRSILPIIGASILMTLGLMAGAVMLVIPYLIFLTMWSVTIPVVVIEGLGPIGAMKRSQELTKGSRLSIFFLILMVGLASSVLNFALTGFNFSAMSGSDISMATLIPQSLMGFVTAVVSGVGQATVYSELRSIKEGLGEDQLAAIFD
jgi:hypothetical protein